MFLGGLKSQVVKMQAAESMPVDLNHLKQPDGNSLDKSSMAGTWKQRLVSISQEHCDVFVGC